MGVTRQSVSEHLDISLAAAAPMNEIAERCWQGLTDPAFTTRSGRHPSTGRLSMSSDWQKGSASDGAYVEAGLAVDPGRAILESGPHLRNVRGHSPLATGTPAG